MRKISQVGCAALCGAIITSPAHADENLLGYSYGAETLPKGETEAYVWVTDRRGKDAGQYNAQDYQLEIEHGIADNVQISGYIDFASHHIAGLEPEFEDVDRDFAFQGLQASVKWAALSPYKDGIGLALYFEPVWKRIDKVSGEHGREIEFESKLILQKNFLDDRLVWIGNLTAEMEFEREKDVDELTGAVEYEHETELALEATTGLSYRVASNWFLGVEGRYHSEYPDFPDAFEREHYAFFAGPTIHYGGKRWWFTATWLPQIGGSPSPLGSDLHLEEHEKREFRLKVGYNF